MRHSPDTPRIDLCLVAVVIRHKGLFYYFIIPYLEKPKKQMVQEVCLTHNRYLFTFLTSGKDIDVIVREHICLKRRKS